MKKSNYKTLQTFMALMVLFLFSTQVEATDVNGVILVDTTWSMEGSPYNLLPLSPSNVSVSVQVAEGVTLTILPGVVVTGNGKSIETWGTLQAIGTADSKITFNNVKIAGKLNSASKANAVVRFQFAEFNSGTPFSGSTSGTDGYGTLSLTDSAIKDALLIYLTSPLGNCYIERNQFLKSGGIIVRLPNAGVKAYIRNNIFYKQTTAYAVNSYSNNATAETIVQYNSFLSTDKTALSLTSGQTTARMTAVENYWNTTDTALIDAMIFDKRDDLNCAGVIQYSPVLSEPHPDTPIPVIKESPVANAGPDQVVLTKITLDGSGSYDPYGSIVSYQWRMTKRDNPSFERVVTGQTVTVPGLEYGFYDVSLTVSDNDNSTATDQMAFAATGPKFTGDINEDGKIGLEEAIHALQVMTRQE